MEQDRNVAKRQRLGKEAKGMVENKGFRPFREAARNEADQLTAAMEDYLEMIYRLQQENQTLRVSAMASALQVGRSSVSKMLRKLAAEGFLIVENYGDVQLTEKGWKQGKALLERHQRVARFLQLAGIKAEQLLEETEKLEHMSSPETLRCLDLLVDYFDQDAAAEARLEQFRSEAMRLGETAPAVNENDDQLNH